MTTPPAPAASLAPRGQPLMRILNAVALALIAASVLAQCLGLALLYGRGSGAPAAGGMPGLIAFTIIPGTVLALAKLVLNLVRCFRDPAARPKVALYAVIVALPVALPLMLAAATSRSDAQAAHGNGELALESEQFLAGAAWARANQPIHDTECKGSQDFQRGCRNAIDLRRKAQRAEGYAWAGRHLPEKAALCQGTPYFVLGCRTYFAERLKKPKPEGLAKYEGMTTAECKEAVNATFEAARAIDLEHENFHSIESTARRHWAPELADCENYDKFAASKFMPAAYDRVNAALGKLKGGLALSDDEKSAVLKDFTRMSTLDRSAGTGAYMGLFNQYLSYLNGGTTGAAPAN